MNCYCVPNVVIVLNMLVKTILLLPLKFYCRDTAYEASCKGVAFVSQFVNFSRRVSTVTYNSLYPVAQPIAL